MLLLPGRRALLAYAALSLTASPGWTQVPFRHVLVDAAGPGEMQIVQVGDLDGDGSSDLIIAGRTSDIVWYEERSNPGSWTRHSLTTAAEDLGDWSTDLELVDIDGDGDADVLTSDWYKDERVVWFENLGAASAWTRHVIGGPRAHDIEVGDFDGDGDPDFVTRTQLVPGGVLEFWRQNTPSSWTRSTFNLPSVSTGEGIDVVDLDDDGDLDVVIPQFWYENVGDFMAGAWVERAYTSAYTHPHTFVKLADMDGDGDPDVLLTPNEFVNTNGRTTWFEAPDDPRDPNWSEHVIDPNVERVTHSLQVGDMDLDGDLDVITAEMHQGSNPDEIRVYYNQDGLGVGWVKQVVDGIGSHNMAVVDAGGDGDLDLFGANWTQSVRVDLWESLLADQGGGDAYCLGTTGCPCDNTTREGGGCAHAEGLGARLVRSGSTSVGSDDLVLRVTDLPSARSGLLFMGTARVTAPFGDGLRCVAGDVNRFPVSNSGNAGAVATGPGLVAFTHLRFEPSGRIQPGQTWHFQYWYRDPAGPCATGFSLSNALTVSFRP